MAINDFKNIENINLNLDKTAQLLQSKDLNIFKTSAKNVTDFGMSKNDVIEFRIYDISNNLLEQSGGKLVSYIHKDDLPKFLKSSIDSLTQEKIFEIDIEKLVKEAGYGNGEFRVVLNFLKNFLGTENNKQKVWIHEVSPSRTEIRIQPLIGTDLKQNQFINNRYQKFLNGASELRENRRIIEFKIDSVELQISDLIDGYLIQKFGQNYLDIIKRDFAFTTNSQYKAFKQKIFTDFKKSIFYQLDGKEFRLGNPNYGKLIDNGIDLDEYYDQNDINTLVYNRLNDSIDFNTQYIVQKEFKQEFVEESNKKVNIPLLQSLLDVKVDRVSNLKRNRTVGDLEQDNIISETPIIAEQKKELLLIIDYDSPPPVIAPAEQEPQPVLSYGGGGGSTFRTAIDYIDNNGNLVTSDEVRIFNEK